MKSVYYIFGYLNDSKLELKSQRKFHFIEEKILCGDATVTVYSTENGIKVDLIDITKSLHIRPVSTSISWTSLSFVDDKCDAYAILKDDFLKDKDLLKLPHKWSSIVCFCGNSLIGISSTFDLCYIEMDDEIKITIENFPTKLRVEAVACGSDHILILSSGHVLSKGLGSRGQLGHGDLENLTDFKEISQLGCVVSNIACGLWHSASLTEAGDVYCWGWNESGQLGVPCFTQKESLENIFRNSEYLEEPNTIHTEPVMVQFPISDWSIIKVQCGSRHTLCLNDDGKVYAFGWGGMGQLGKEDDLSYDYPVEIEDFIATDILCTQWSSILTLNSNSDTIFDQ